jgi:hypothetical protein
MSTGDEVLRNGRDMLRAQIQASIVHVRRAARRYRRVSTILLLTGMICGAVATALAGDAFRGGPLAANVAQTTTGRVPSALPPGWRNVCGIIAVLTLAGTLATGTNSVLKIADHQARTSGCVAALAALQAPLFQESVLGPAALDKAKADLETIRLTYDEYFP